MTAIAKIFKSGNSRAVRLPKQFNIEGDRVYIRQVGKDIILSPIEEDPWQAFLDSLDMFPEDFMETRDQGVQPEGENPFD